MEITIQEIARKIQKSKNIVVLTGAGMSTNSGIPDFRGTEGLYTKYTEDILSLESFSNNTEEFYKAFQEKFSKIYTAVPNRGHEILSEWEDRGKVLGIITQNIDGLHQKAGSKNVIEFHGTIQTFTSYEEYLELIVRNDVNIEDIVDYDGNIDYYKEGYLHKPNVVLFGEDVHGYNESVEMISKADLVLIIGTQMEVSPFNNLPIYTSNYDSTTECIAINKTVINNYGYTLYQNYSDITEVLEEVNRIINN